MKVICSGMPKTGTKSMAAALRILGFTVYDFEEQYLHQHDEWERYLDTGDDAILKKMFENVDAITDGPGCVFWEELVNLFPEAKVVHTERSSEEEWLTSVQNHMDTTDGIMWMWWLSPNMRKMTNHLIKSGTICNSVLIRPRFPWQKLIRYPPAAKIRYRQLNTRVRQAVPSERLLIAKHQDGWGPLCAFLGVPVPDSDVPYPHRNKGASIVKEVVETSVMFESIKRDINIFYATVFVIMAVGIYFIWNLYLNL